MKYRLYAVRIFSHRWEESLIFYKDVIRLPLAFSDASMGWAQFEVGTAHLGLERCDPADDESRELVGRFIGISLEVDDIQGTYEALLAQGVEFVAPPEKQAWGGTLAHFKDPDDNVVTLLGA
ncbi:MAG: VOC family protein [Pseudomonadota bacterium]